MQEQELIERIGELEADVHCRVSFCEIYNEEVFDLLNLDKKPLKIKFGKDKGFFSGTAV